MGPFRTLYYPSWNPPVLWFRSALLLFDQIQVIRPQEVADPGYHEANRAVIDLLPETFAEIRKKHYEMTLDPKNLKLLRTIFNQIATHKRLNNNIVTLRFPSAGGVTVPGYAFLHVSKLPAVVTSALRDRSLIHEKAEKFVERTYNMHDFRIVERKAANVVLALIAEYYGRTNRLRTVTDERLGYLAAVLNRNPLRRRDVSAVHLASTIMRIQIPARISTLTPKQYVSLRKRYADLREPFQHAVRTICDDHLIATIETRRQFEEAVHEATRHFSDGVDRMLKKRWAARLGTWGPMSLGIISTLCRVGTPMTVPIGAGLDVCLRIYGALKGSAPMTDTIAAQSLFATLRSEFAHPVLMRHLVLN